MKNKIKKYSFMISEILCLITFLMLFSCNSYKTNHENNSITSIEGYKALRNEKLNMPRPVIHNNDGCDTYLYPADREFSLYNFLDFRAAGLKGTDVSTISYCTISSSFGQFTHNTKVGEFLTLTHNRPGKRNVVPEFIKLGTDPLEVTSKFAHENGFEFFWSNRINDTHDSGHRPDKPYERWSNLKSEHPEYLFGTYGEKLPYGRWSAIDFSNTKIRDLCVKYYTEVCENYDVDGIELDFFRHLYLFKNVARGGVASAAQLDMLTDMVVQIREMTERVGMKKGKPILVLIRVPDSKGYCQGVGIDLEKWMAQGLVDIVVGSGYFRLNTWDYLVNEGHKYNIKIYAGLSEPRVKNEHPLLIRLQNAVYRARSAAAMQAGVDGIYVFNEYNTRSKYLSEIGNATKLKDKNNLYFVSYRNANPESYLENGKSFSSLPLISPSNPAPLNTKPVSLPIEIGDESKSSKIALIVYSTGDNTGTVAGKLNGVPCKYRKSSGDGLSIYDIDPSSVKKGKNELEFSYNSGQNQLTLLDAAILFYRDADDSDTKKLASLCFEN